MKTTRQYKGTTLVLFFLLITTVISCGTSGGTIDSPEENPNINLDLIAAEPLLDQLCAKVSSCLPNITKEDCLEIGRASSSLPTALEVSEDIGDYNDLIEAEVEGTIQAKSLPYVECTSDLETLSCSDINSSMEDAMESTLVCTSTCALPAVESVDVQDQPWILDQALQYLLNFSSCQSVFSRTEQDNMCEAGGAQARWFSSGCGDSCFAARGENVMCTQAFEYDCDCGQGYCWNGSNCEEI